MTSIPMYTVMMDKSGPGTAGFDYKLQISIVFVGSLLAGGMSGLIAQALGYQEAFVISARASRLILLNCPIRFY